MSVFRTAGPLVAATGAAFGAAAYGTYAAPVLALTRPGRRAFRPLTRVPEGKRVVLTFDDGPASASTPRVLDRLEELDVRSTFFCVGEQVDRDAGVAREIVRRGHEVACHGSHHRNHLARSPKETHDDLVRARGVIEDACGVDLRYFRPPYGVFNASSWRTASKLGWQRVLWSRWTRDWEKRATAESITGRATDGLVDGEIVLLHDADTYSAPGCYEDLLEAIPRIVDRARRLGLEPVALGEALAT
jgi:peptidoglycan/xylan/chitin deacetylase (PgdA/CDA1 family)